MEDCVFCKIAQGQLPCHKVYEDERIIAFEDISPVSEGHTLVVPKRHAESIFDISEEDLAAVHLSSRRIAAAIKKALAPSGVAILQLNGRGVNQVVMHYHLHLIPRAPEGPALPVSHWDPEEVDPEALARTAARISEAL